MPSPEFNLSRAVQVGRLHIDFESHLARRPNGQIVHLDPQEIDLLCAMHADVGLTREELGERLGAYKAVVDDLPFDFTAKDLAIHARSADQVSVVLHALREKLGEDVIARQLRRDAGGALFWLRS